MQSPKRRQYKYAKSRYQVKNWGEYEAGLRRRGDLTVWLSDEALDAWRVPPSGKPGGQRRYADIAIEAALMIRMVFHLPLRQTEGFLYSLMQLLDVTPITRRCPGVCRSWVRSRSTSLPLMVRCICSSTALG